MWMWHHHAGGADSWLSLPPNDSSQCVVGLHLQLCDDHLAWRARSC
jgi:hypothetical protein